MVFCGQFCPASCMAPSLSCTCHSLHGSAALQQPISGRMRRSHARGCAAGWVSRRMGEWRTRTGSGRGQCISSTMHGTATDLPHTAPAQRPSRKQPARHRVSRGGQALQQRGASTRTGRPCNLQLEPSPLHAHETVQCMRAEAWTTRHTGMQCRAGAYAQHYAPTGRRGPHARARICKMGTCT